MSESEAAACFAPDHLARFLDERLDEAEGKRIEAHLSTCDACQHALEGVAGDPDHWSGAREHIESVTDFDTGDVPEKDDPDGLEEIRRLCDPSDDPASVGRIGAYEVRGFVGRGTAGIVLKAFEPSLDRFVALKLLSPVFRGHGATRQRFEREARAIAAVRDPHVVPVHGVDEHHGLPFLVMGYVPGESLEERIKRTGPLGTEAAARVGLQIARALAAAHAQGVVHRDVKPANVLLEGTVERAYVTDFGLASVADEAAITLSGMISGTPHYMSPEQARGEIADARSDLFSLGSLLYAVCAGDPPFHAENVYGVLRRVTETEPLPLGDAHPDVAPWMAALVAKLLAKDPADRFQTASEVADVLAAELSFAQNPLGSGPPARDWMPPAAVPSGSGGGRRRRTAAALACAAAGLGALAVAVLRDEPDVNRPSGERALLGGMPLASAGSPPDVPATVPPALTFPQGAAPAGLFTALADGERAQATRIDASDFASVRYAGDLEQDEVDELVGSVLARAIAQSTIGVDLEAGEGLEQFFPGSIKSIRRVTPVVGAPSPSFGFALGGSPEGADEICVEAEGGPELASALCAPGDEACADVVASPGLLTVCSIEDGLFVERDGEQHPVQWLGAAARTLDGLVGKTVGSARRGAVRSFQIDEPLGNVDGLSFYLPAQYREGHDTPVILYLQGSAGVGGDVEDSARAGLLGHLTEGTAADTLRDDFIVVAPHITSGQYHDHPEVIEGILERVLSATSADPRRVHLTGPCLGGHGSWGLVRTLRGRFASVAPLGADPEDLDGDFESLKGVSVWLGHNGEDTSYPFEPVAALAGEIESVLRAEFLRSRIELLDAEDVFESEWVFTSDPAGEHDAWSDVYGSDAFYGWLHGQVHCEDTWGEPWEDVDADEETCDEESCDDDCEESCGDERR